MTGETRDYHIYFTGTSEQKETGDSDRLLTFDFKENNRGKRGMQGGGGARAAGARRRRDPRGTPAGAPSPGPGSVKEGAPSDLPRSQVRT